MGVTTEWQALSQATGVNEWDPRTVFIGFGAFWIQIITEIWQLALQYTLSSLDKRHCSILLACYFTLITGYVCLLVVTIYGCTLLTTPTHSCPNIVIYGSKKQNKQTKKCFEVLKCGSHSEYVNILYTVGVIELCYTQWRHGMINFISTNRLND